MKRAIALLTLLGLVGTASASTIAHWRFEEGTPGVQHTGDHDNFYADISGNTNHLSAWDAAGNPTATSDLPFTSQGGTANAVALDFDPASSQNLGTFGPGDVNDKALDSYSFSNGWTIEATFKTHSYWWSVIVGKDGQPDAGMGEANLAFKIRDDSHSVECGFFDDATNWVWLATETLKLDRWYSLAATYDNASKTYNLYLKQQDGGDYVLQGTTTNIVGGAALNLATRFWSVGRGMWAGNPTDVFNGIIDEVKISDVALAPSEFVNQDGFTIPFDIEKPADIDVARFTGWSDSFRLYAGEYWSPAGLAFSGAQWQISTDMAFASTDWDSGVLGATDLAAVPANALAAGSYYVRVRYQGDGTTWSDWSDVEVLDAVDHTIAYWRLENGVNGEEHPGDQDNWYPDSSGNGNHMSSWWDGARPMATNGVPFSTIPRIGANTLSLDFEGDDIGTFGPETGAKMVESYAFTNGWTIECSFKARDLLGWRVMLGKDGKRGLGPEQPFGFKLAPEDQNFGLRCLVLKDDDNFDFIDTPDNSIVAEKWYSVVATFDNADFKLYLKSEDDADFTLHGTLNRPQGISFGNLNIASWTIGRGMWDGGSADGFFGLVDEVRISDVAMRPEEFISKAAPIPPIGDIAIEQGASNIDLTWTTGSDYNYVLLEKTTLQSPSWSTNMASIPGEEGSVTVSVPADQAAAFYKVTSED